MSRVCLWMYATLWVIIVFLKNASAGLPLNTYTMPVWNEWIIERQKSKGHISRSTLVIFAGGALPGANCSQFYLLWLFFFKLWIKKIDVWALNWQNCTISLKNIKYRLIISHPFIKFRIWSLTKYWGPTANDYTKGVTDKKNPQKDSLLEMVNIY